MAQIQAAVDDPASSQTTTTDEDPDTLPVYRVPDVAKILGCTEKTVWRYVSSKRWPHLRRQRGREVWFSKRDVERIQNDWDGFVAVQPTAAQSAG